GDVMARDLKTAEKSDSIDMVSNLMIENNINQVPITDDAGKLCGIVTSWDITKAIAEKKKKLSEFMTRKVITSLADDPLDLATRKIEKHEINSTPVVDKEGRLIGIITLSDITRAYRGGRG
ncbi:MAG: CBS domain-containing protein, partial [Methanobacteriota archaeon]